MLISVKYKSNSCNSLRLLINVLVIIAGWLCPIAVLADCGLSLSASTIDIVWNQNFNFRAVNITISKSRHPACSYSLAFTKGGASDYNRIMTGAAANLNYQIFQDSSLSKVLKDLPDILSTDNYITSSFPEGASLTQTMTYYVQIPTDLATTPALKPPGTYLDSFIIKAYDGTDFTSFKKPEATASVTISTVMPRIIELSVSQNGAFFDPSKTSLAIDFAELTPGTTQTCSLLVRSNAGYSLTISSENSGILRHTSATIGTAIPYIMRVNSTAQNLSGPVEVASGSGQTSLSGIANSLGFTIDDSGQAMAGQYSDNLTITVATTE
ncbi:MAG: spore coat protein U domain-containing protein [Bdellovibrionota bacterium]